MHRHRAALLNLSNVASAACLAMLTVVGLSTDDAYAQTTESAETSSTDTSLMLGGLTLVPLGSAQLSTDQPSLSLGIAPTHNSLPLSTTPHPQISTPAADPSEGLGTRLSIGQPLNMHFLGGRMDWRAAATVEQASQGEAYGLSLSLGSLAESPVAPPSDLRVGLTYGREPTMDEHGVILDFSYSF